MDGTLLTSTTAAERVWAAWARRRGLDVEAFLPTIHGVRAVETIGRLGLPGIDPVAEAEAITRAEIADVEGVRAVRGAERFLLALPVDRWAVVTSAPRALAERRLEAAGLPLPPAMICAEDVGRGKPSPEGFLAGARLLGAAPADCLVFEDAEVGVRAAEAAGMAVAVVTAMHAHPLATPHPAVRDYAGLTVRRLADGALELVEA